MDGTAWRTSATAGLFSFGGSLYGDMYYDTQTFIGQDGYFFIQCPVGYTHFRGSVVLNGKYVFMDNNDAADFESDLNTSVLLKTSDDYSAVTFLRLEARVGLAPQRFGLSRGIVRVTVVPDVGTLSQAFYCPVAPAPAVSPCPRTDNIRIGYPRVVNSEDAIFTALHEYGHAFHFYAISGWDWAAEPLSGVCGGPHSFSSPSNAQCAFREGFADFFAAWIGASSLVAQDVLMKDPWTTYPGFITDGVSMEARVAALLLDLVDGANDLDWGNPSIQPATGKESVTYPARWIADLIAGCHSSGTLSGFPVTWGHIDSADQLVVCLEASIAPSSVANPSTGGPLLNRGANGGVVSFVSVSPGVSPPAGWSPTAIRSLWMFDLYHVGSPPH